MVLNVMDRKIDINGVTVVSSADNSLINDLDRAAFCSCDICIFDNKEVLYEEFGELRFIERHISTCDGGCSVVFDNGFTFRAHDVNFDNVYHLEHKYDIFHSLSDLEENGSRNSLVILETPSAFLHPRESVQLGKMLIDMVKQGFSFLLDTNSPYLIRAIEVFSAKKSIADKCKYYLFSEQCIEDVTLNTNKIYRTFATPLEELKQIEYMEVM